MRWAILTGEYPPDPGGVSDYTRLVAEALAAAGDSATVYAPPGAVAPERPGVTVVRLPDHFGPRGLLALDRALARTRPDRLLVQYVPHAYGYKAMNVPFASWVATRGKRLAPVWVMFHEVAFPLLWRPLRYALLASVNALMARLLAGAADRIFASVPGWEPVLKRFCPWSPRPEWLPVPCNVGTAADPTEVAAVRTKFAPDPARLVGHFGTYSPSTCDILTRTFTGLLGRDAGVRVLLLGRHSDRYCTDLAATAPGLAGRAWATGELAPDQLAAHLRACDVLIQPYPDGVSSRRGSTMAGLANGVPVVTNLGPLSEAVWTGGAVAAAPVCDPNALAEQAAGLLADEPVRSSTGHAGLALYNGSFTLDRTVATLRGHL